MLALNKLVSTHKARKRIGRGGSRGGTSGRGHKGQKARTSGTVGPLFEGGQLPLHRRLPKRGFNNARFAVEYEIVKLGTLHEVFTAGTDVTKELMMEKGLIRSKGLIKVLVSGELTKKLRIQADAWSKTAEEAVTKLGGELYKAKES